LLEKIAILEAFNGRDFYSFTLQENGSLHIAAGSNVSSTVKPPSGKDVIVTETHLTINPEQAALLDKAYQTLLDSVYEALLPQTRLKPYLDAISLKLTDTGISFDYSAVIQQLDVANKSNTVESILVSFELQHFINDDHLTRSLQFQRSQWINYLNTEQSVELNKYINDVWFSNKINSYIYIGTNEDDVLRGNYSSNNELYGGDGNDILSVGLYSTDNILAGGKGNDILYGNYGSDTYIFNLGDGKDQIIENGRKSSYDYRSGYLYKDDAIDTLRFGEGIRPEDIRMRREGNDFLLIHSNGSDQVLIKDIFSYNYGSPYAEINSLKVVEQISFADGTVWTWNQIVSQGFISYANDNGGVFYGWRGSNIIHGGDGNDIIYGGNGVNQFYGGKGDDILYGASDADTYIFNLGDGKDQIFERGYKYSDKAIDTLRFGEGIHPEDIKIQRNGNDFLLIHSNGTDQVRIKDVFNGDYVNSDKVVEQVTFANGTVWQWDQIILRGSIIHANNSDDTLHGLQGDDTIYGSIGDDVIYGHNGDDVIYGGDGNDILDGGLGRNQLHGGSGDDILRVAANAKDNLFVGGKGDDSLYGSRNADTYVFNLGDGKDQIFEQGHYYNNAIDTLSFGEGIRPEDIKVQREGNDFLFIHKNGTDQVRVKNVFNGDYVNLDKVVEQVTFANGTVWHWNELVSQDTVLHADVEGSTLHGLRGNDIIYGNAGDDILYGHEGNDVIYGGDGNDIIDGGSGSNQLYGGNGDDVLRVDDYSNNNLLVGGTGNDIIYGSSGADTYLFNLGDGQDHIFDPGCYNYYYGDNAVDTLRFGEGIRPEDISMRREGDDFLFIHSNGRDQVLIKNVFAMDTSHYSDVFSSWMSSGGMIKQVTFADGTVWDWKKLKQHTIISYADDHSNSFKFWDGSNIIYFMEVEIMISLMERLVAMNYMVVLEMIY